MIKFHTLVRLLMVSSIAILFSQSINAMIVYDPINAIYNRMTSVKEIEQVIQQARQIQNQLQGLKYEAQNLQTLPDQKWDNAQQALVQLGGVVQQGNAIAYSMSNVDQQFKQRYPGYSAAATTNYSQNYKSWVQTNQDTMNGVLDQMNMSYEQLQQEDAMNQLLAERARSPQGRMQAIQIGNEIAAEQVAQLEKLKATMIAQTNAQAEYYAYQSQKDAAQQQSVDAVVQNTNTTFPVYQGNSQFGTVPQFGQGK